MKRRLCALLLPAAITVAFTATAFAAGNSASPPPKTTVVLGRVVSNTDKAIPNAKVFIITYSQHESKVVTITADKQGRFKKSVDSQYYGMAAVADGYCASMPAGTVQMGHEGEIKLWPEEIIKGKVVDENGIPLQEITVNPSDIDAYNYSTISSTRPMERVRLIDGLIPMAVKTGKDGSFALHHLPRSADFEQCRYTISTSAEGRALIRRGFGKQTMSTGIELVDPQECVVEGAIKLPNGSDADFKGVNLWLKLDNRWGGDLRAASVSADGKFRLAGLPPGNHTIVVPAPSSYWDGNKEITPAPRTWTLPAANIELAPKQVKSVDLVAVTGSLLKGTVVNKSTGKPITEAGIIVTDSGNSPGAFARPVRVDAEGKFAVRVAPGHVTITANDLNRTFIDPSTAPKLELTAIDGEVKTDIVLEADLVANPDLAYQALNKPVPDNFELKPGTYNLTWDPEADTSSVARMPAYKWDYVAKGAFKKTPKLVSTNPRYWIYRLDCLGNGMIGVILDESKGTGKGYDTVYIDTNRDWDLTNDKPLSISTAPLYELSFTEWVSVNTSQGTPKGSKLSNPTLIRLSKELVEPTGKELYGCLYKKGAWRGTIESSAGPIECVLIDSNGNGSSADCIKRTTKNAVRDKGDILCLDTNGYGKAVISPYGSHAIVLSPVCKIGKQFYSIKPTALGDKITIEPYSGPMGSLTIRANDVCGMSGTATNCYAWGPQGDFSLTANNGPIMLPVGDYNVASATIMLQSGKSRVPISCTPNATVRVQPDMNAVVALTGKPACSIDPKVPQLTWKQGQTVAMTFAIKIGTDATLSSIGNRQPNFAPKVRLFDKAGKLVYTTTAGYT